MTDTSDPPRPANIALSHRPDGDVTDSHGYALFAIEQTYGELHGRWEIRSARVFARRLSVDSGVAGILMTLRTGPGKTP